MKKLIITSALILGFTAPLANASSGTNIDVWPISEGAWVTVTQHGMPVEGAMVNGQYTTSDNGRAFVYVNSEAATSEEFTAVTPDGEVVSTMALIPRQ